MFEAVLHCYSLSFDSMRAPESCVCTLRPHTHAQYRSYSLTVTPTQSRKHTHTHMECTHSHDTSPSSSAETSHTVVSCTVHIACHKARMLDSCLCVVPSPPRSHRRLPKMAAARHDLVPFACKASVPHDWMCLHRPYHPLPFPNLPLSTSHLPTSIHQAVSISMIVRTRSLAVASLAATQ